MQIKKALINDRFRGSMVIQKCPENFAFQPVKSAIFLKSSILFNSFYCLFCL